MAKFNWQVKGIRMYWINECWNMYIDTYPKELPKEEFVFEEREGVYRAVGSITGRIKYFSWSDDNTIPGGAYSGPVLMKDGSIRNISGAWSSRASVVNMLYPEMGHIVDVAIDQMSAALTVEDVRSILNEHFKGIFEVVLPVLGIHEIKYGFVNINLPKPKYEEFCGIVNGVLFNDYNRYMDVIYALNTSGKHFTGCNIKGCDPVHQHNDGTWWFYDEAWHDEYGPNFSHEACLNACMIKVFAPAKCPECGSRDFSHNKGVIYCVTSSCDWKCNTNDVPISYDDFPF